jgi:hypothetical protein
MNFISEEDFRLFVLRWGVENPIDRWWRRKHNIRFNSEEHRSMSFIDMAFEYQDDLMVKQAIKSIQEPYRPGDFLKERTPIQEVSNDDLIRIFEKRIESSKNG